MSIVEILLLAVGLSMDAAAVCLAIGAAGRARGARPTFRLAFHFGLFQFFMPILGWLAGTSLVSLVANLDHWIALALLVFVGGRMIRSGLRDSEEEVDNDPSRGWSLVMLALATSIDALAVGLSLAVLRVDIWYPSAVIGVVTGSISLLALEVGTRVSGSLGRRMEIAGGLVLIAIGVRIVAEHIAG